MSFKRKLTSSTTVPFSLSSSSSSSVRSVTTIGLSLLWLWSVSPSSCLLSSTVFVEALAASVSKQSSTSSGAAAIFPTTSLQTIDATQMAIFDGAEWTSIQNLIHNDQKETIMNNNNKKGSTATKYGYANVIVGTDTEGQRIVGMQVAVTSQDNEKSSSSSSSVYQESVARIPANIQTEDAMATYIAGISTIHAVLPKVEQVGGSDDTTIATGDAKVVVVGGNDLACFAAEGLSSLGVQVCLVSTGNPKVRSTNSSSNNKNSKNGRAAGKVEIVKPAVGSDGTGFSEYVGQFDSLLDTLGNERPMNTVVSRRNNASDVDSDNDNDDDGPILSLQNSKSVLHLLKSRHNCHTYVSTLTHCQSLVAKEGILGGPRQADEYSKRIGQPSFVAGNPECQPLQPWSNLGSTVESLLEAGIVFSSQTRNKLYPKSQAGGAAVRGWNLGDFWEQSTWPRDSSGSAQIRFGLPVVEDPNLDDEPMIAEAPYRPGAAVKRETSTYEAFDFSNKDDYLEDSPPTPVQENPFVYQVAGVQGVKTEIMEQKSDCILFLSAKFCKTCKTINPQYTRMARIAKEEKDNVVFAKAETSGRWGKELGRYLQVEAVPAFILFRKGERFGTPLSVSRLPSRKMDRAIDLLESGAEWDPDILREDENKAP